MLLAQEHEIGTEMSRSYEASSLCNATSIKVVAHILGHKDLSHKTLGELESPIHPCVPAPMKNIDNHFLGGF